MRDELRQVVDETDFEEIAISRGSASAPAAYARGASGTTTAPASELERAAPFDARDPLLQPAGAGGSING